MPDYPEHEKLKAIKDRSQACGEFIEWLNHSKRIHLAEYSHGELYPTTKSLLDLLADFFEIDRQKLEDEKLAMLAEQRRLNEDS